MFKKFIFEPLYSQPNINQKSKFLPAIVSQQTKQSNRKARWSEQKTKIVYFVTKTKHKVIQNQTYLLKVLAMHAKYRPKLWRNSWNA